jgi:ubiquinone/menaquinone biosynthesis C-methylase UbiE
MISRSTDYVEYCRRTATELHNLQDLALRGRNKETITRLVHERIVQEVNPGPGDDLVDIGCGDGTLLRMAQQAGTRSAVGLLATEEEATLVRRLGFDVRKGLSHELPLPDACASVVVCNNVLLIVPRQNIPATLREICRIARPGARVFLGEIPFVPGPPPEPQFETAQETLSYLYRQYGLRTWFGMARRMAYWKLTGQPIVLHDGRVVSFFAQPEEFIALAQATGLELVRYWRREYPNTRNNYLFRKPAGVSSMN